MDGDYANVVLTSLNQVDGAENPSGLQEDSYLLIVSEVATWGQPIADPLNPAAVLTIPTNHVMVAGKAPIPVYSMFDKSDFESPLAGEKGAMIFQPAATFFIPQPTDNNAALLSILKNCRLVALVTRTQGGGFMQIGTKELSARIKSGSVMAGKGPTGIPGVTFVVEATSIHPYYKYTGTLPAPAA